MSNLPSNLVSRLRLAEEAHCRQKALSSSLLGEAADEIERLRVLLGDSRPSIDKAADADCVCGNATQLCKHCSPHRALRQRIDDALSGSDAPPSSQETTCDCPPDCQGPDNTSNLCRAEMPVSETFRQGIDRIRRELHELKQPVPDETLNMSKSDLSQKAPEKCPNCFGDKTICMSDGSKRMCEYCGVLGLTLFRASHDSPEVLVAISVVTLSERVAATPDSAVEGERCCGPSHGQTETGPHTAKDARRERS